MAVRRRSSVRAWANLAVILAVAIGIVAALATQSDDGTGIGDSPWVLYIGLWLFCGLIGSAVADSKGKSNAGFLLGFLLGPIGLLIAFALGRTPEKEAERNLKVRGIEARMLGQEISPAGWKPDPLHRHELRYWDGFEWSGHVSDGGVQAVDPPGIAPPT